MNNTVNFNTTTPQICFAGKKISKKNVKITKKSENQNPTKEEIKKSLWTIFKEFGEKLRNGGHKNSKKEPSNISNIIGYYKELRNYNKNNADSNYINMENKLKDIGDFLKNIE